MGVHIREIYPGRWYFRITYKKIRKTKAAGSKERAVDLKKKLTTALELYGLDAFKVIEEEKGSDAMNLKPKAPTLDKFQERWLEELDRTDLKRSTRDNYKFLLTKHIIPEFGNAPLDMLDYSMVKRWVIKMSGRYSKDTVRLMIAVLRVMMQEAVNEGLIVANPVAKLGKEGMGEPYACRRSGSRLRVGTARPRQSVDHLEDIFALGSGHAPGYYGRARHN